MPVLLGGCCGSSLSIEESIQHKPHRLSLLPCVNKYSMRIHGPRYREKLNGLNFYVVGMKASTKLILCQLISLQEKATR